VLLEEIQSFSNFEVLANKAKEGFIAGLHKSPFRGFSVECDDLPAKLGFGGETPIESFGADEIGNTHVVQRFVEVVLG